MMVIKRKNFFYLAHSYRNDGKVISKELYLGKEVPKNLKEIEDLLFRDCLKETILKLNKIKRNFSKEWKDYPESVKKDILLDFSIDFTYNTNAIEGSTITKDETEDIIKRKLGANKPLHDVQETFAHSKLFLEVLNSKEKLDLKLLLRWHSRLFQETKPDIAGKLRDYLVRVGDYRAPDWQDLNKLMKEFFLKINTPEMHPVELAARVHYQFEKIHPFGDGNGRIGRLIINHLLRQNGYPLIIIKYKKRSAYYKALSKTENDFVMYFIKSYIKTNKKYY